MDITLQLKEENGELLTQETVNCGSKDNKEILAELGTIFEWFGKFAQERELALRSDKEVPF